MGRKINTQTYQLFPMLDMVTKGFEKYTIYQTLNECELFEKDSEVLHGG